MFIFLHALEGGWSEEHGGTGKVLSDICSRSKLHALEGCWSEQNGGTDQSDLCLLPLPAVSRIGVSIVCCAGTLGRVDNDVLSRIFCFFGCS